MDLINPQLIRLIIKTIEKNVSLQQELRNDREPLSQGPPKTFPKINVNIQPQPEKKAPVQEVNPQLLMNSNEQSSLMKEMLKLPQDLKTLLSTMQEEGQKITPESLKQLLETNSKEVINKLLKLIQQTPYNEQNTEQLKTLINVLHQAVPGKEAPPQDVIKHILLLYLPWLPLPEHQKLESWFEKKGGECEESDDNVALVVYISTINLGRFKVIIFIDKAQNLEIVIQNTEGQEKEILKKVLKIIKTGLHEKNIKAQTQMSIVKQQNFTKSDKKEVTISQVNNLAPVVLTAAQKIAQIIFEFDEKISLLAKREKNLK